MIGRRGAEAGRGSLMARGAVYLALAAALVGLVCAQFVGVFADRVTVTALLTDTGDALVPGSDVKLRGVLVGRVGEISRDAGRRGAVVELRLDPARAGAIPAAVTARSLPANFFGQAFVDLVPPAAAAPATAAPARPIAAGARIPQDTSQETVELQDVFAKLFRVLSAVKPAKLATALGALAEALDGRGARAGELIGRTDAYLRALRPALPDLRADITALARFAETLQAQAPDLLDSVDDVLVLARTLVERQQQFVMLLSGGLAVSRTGADFLDGNGDELVRVARQTRRIIGAFADNPRAFSDGFVDLGRFLGGFALGDSGRASLDVVIEPGPLRSYSAADCPRYPGLAGPNCGSGAAGAGPGPGGPAGAVPAYGGIGAVGSVADKLALAQVLAALDGGRGGGASDVGMLLAGSLLRGKTVLLPGGASAASPAASPAGAR